MPTYEYRCKSCGNELEVVQSFSDDPLTTCERCGGPLRKLFGNVGIAFKGSGFYKTDSRSTSGAGAGAASGGSDGGSGGGSGSSEGSSSSSGTSSGPASSGSSDAMSKAPTGTS